MVFCPGHRDIQKAALLLQFFAGVQGKVSGNTAIDGIEDEDGLPFLALG